MLYRIKRLACGDAKVVLTVIVFVGVVQKGANPINNDVTGEGDNNLLVFVIVIKELGGL